MSSSESLVRRQLSFAIAGVIFGFLMGYVVAHEIYGGRFGAIPVSAAAPVPSVSGQRGPEGGAIPGHEGVSMESMESVRRELDALKERVRQDPKDSQALGRLGDLYMEAGMYDRSVEYYRQAIAVKPDDVHLRTDLGASLMMQGKASEAKGELEQAVAIDPGHSKTWYTLGFALIQTGEYDRGEAALAKSLDLSPGAFDMGQLKAEIEKLKAGRAASPGPGAGS